MILLDEPNDIAKNAATNTLQDIPSLGQPSGPPPPYTPRATEPPRATESEPLLPRPKVSASRRFLTAFSVACLVLLLVSCLVGSAVVSWRGGSPDSPPPPHPLPPPDTPEQHRCTPLRDWRRQGSPDDEAGHPWAITELYIPSDAKRLLFESFGDLAAGNTFISADPTYEGHEVMFQIAAEHDAQSVLELAQVCHWAEGNGRYTSQVLASSPAEHKGSVAPINFTVIVVLPTDTATPSIPNHYPDIHTNMPLFSHTVRSLEGRVRLGHLSINTTQRMVNVDKLIASKVDIATTNAEIQGAFDVSSSLTLSAPGGQLHIFADMTNSNSSKQATNMTLSASNGSILSVIRLHSSSWHGEGGLFNVTARGTNASVTLDVSAAPVDSRLVLNAQAVGARADVVLHPTFEGMYLVEAARAGSARLYLREDVEDPAGRGRKRRVDTFNWRNQRIAGFLGWSGAPDELVSRWGSATVESNEAASLTA